MGVAATIKEKTMDETTMEDAIIFCFRNRCDELSPDVITRLLAETGYAPRDARDAAFVTARRAYYQRSVAEATRLGLLPHPERRFRHNPIVLVAEAVGDTAGQALAARHGFPWREPGSLWDVLETRRDGDACIALIGDDRGRPQHHTYWIAVAWSPSTLADALGYTPGLR
jgi:hypothetical protein